MADIKTMLEVVPCLMLLPHRLPIRQSPASIIPSQIMFLGLLLFASIRFAHSCAFHANDHESDDLRRPPTLRSDYIALTKANLEYRDAHKGRLRAHVTTAITNVAVFDGLELSDPRTVVISNGRIIDEGSWVREEPHETIDGAGRTLLPGFIDSHFHPETVAHLKEAARYGVTTGIVMACPEPLLCASLQGHIGLPRLILASSPGAAVGSVHGRLAGLNESTALGPNSTSSVTDWVDRQVASGADLIKLIAETPGLDQATLTAATVASHARGLSVACHAADYKSVQQAIAAGVDQIHHVPLDKALNGNEIARFQAISVPTLIMMRKTSEAIPVLNFSASIASARALHEGGITILAGTDANAQNLAPGHPGFGESIHAELELLVSAGLEPLQALRSATMLPADVWGLRDRGRIEPGMVADLVLVQGDPSKNISVTRQIRKVWVGGHAYEG